jgi:hypothetical protein
VIQPNGGTWCRGIVRLFVCAAPQFAETNQGVVLSFNAVPVHETAMSMTTLAESIELVVSRQVVPTGAVIK